MMVDGRPDLPGPLAQVWLDDDADDTARAGDPVAYVIASGRAHHAGPGGFRGLTGNSKMAGIEARNNGRGEAWSPAMRDAYRRANAALCDGGGFDETWICGHHEWTHRKIDPAGIDMDAMRTDVGRLLRPPAPTPAPPTIINDEDDMRIIKAPTGLHARIEGGTFMVYPQDTEADNLVLLTDALLMLGEGRKVQEVSTAQWNYEKATRARIIRGENFARIQSS